MVYSMNECIAFVEVLFLVNSVCDQWVNEQTAHGGRDRGYY